MEQQPKQVELAEASPSASPEHCGAVVGSGCGAVVLASTSPSEVELLEEPADASPVSVVEAAASLDVSQLGTEDLRGHVFHLGGRTYAVLSCAVPPPPRLEGLSRAETEVVFAALNGLTNEEIAATRGRSIFTIQNQLAAAWRKLGVSSRHEAAALLAGRRRVRAAPIELPALSEAAAPEAAAPGDDCVEDVAVDDAAPDSAALGDGCVGDGCVGDGCVDGGCVDGGCVDGGCVDDGCVDDGSLQECALQAGALQAGALGHGALANEVLEEAEL